MKIFCAKCYNMEKVGLMKRIKQFFHVGKSNICVKCGGNMWMKFNPEVYFNLLLNDFCYKFNVPIPKLVIDDALEEDFYRMEEKAIYIRPDASLWSFAHCFRHYLQDLEGKMKIYECIKKKGVIIIDPELENDANDFANKWLLKEGKTR